MGSRVEDNRWMEKGIKDDRWIEKRLKTIDGWMDHWGTWRTSFHFAQLDERGDGSVNCESGQVKRSRIRLPYSARRLVCVCVTKCV